MSVAELLDQLAHAPTLRGAACRGRPELFDADRNDRDAIAAATAVCASCPVLRDCRAGTSPLPDMKSHR